MRDFSNYKPIDLERPQSNCCGVDVDPDYLICPHCKEHCAIEEPSEQMIEDHNLYIGAVKKENA
jgi:hypothetical protein